MQYMKRKNIKILISMLFIFSGISMLIYDYYDDYNRNKTEEKNIEVFFEYEEETKNKNIVSNVTRSDKKKIDNIKYIAILEIPKIDLKKGLVEPNSSLNNVNSNIEILNPVEMPDQANGTFILASHSGSSKVAYFDRLNELIKEDKVYVYYNNVKYIYEISNYYKENKDGDISIKKGHFDNVIVLTTCDKYHKNKQIIYIGNLIVREKY